MYMSATASTTIESALILLFSKCTLEAEAAVRTEASIWTYPFVFPCSQASTQMLFWTVVKYSHILALLISRHSHWAQHLLLSVLIHVCTYVCIIYVPRNLRICTISKLHCTFSKSWDCANSQIALNMYVHMYTMYMYKKQQTLLEWALMKCRESLKHLGTGLQCMCTTFGLVLKNKAGSYM